MSRSHQAGGYLLPLLTALALLALMPSNVLAAGQPDRSFAELPSAIYIAAGDMCAFPVLLEPTVNREYAITFFDSNGVPTRQIVTGTLKSRLTNLADPTKVVEFNSSGPGEYDFNPDGSLAAITFYGPSLQWTPLATMILTGRLTVVVDASGALTTTGITGHQIDPCALIS